MPYDAGYYAEIKVEPSSEYWFNNGGPTGTVPACVDYLNFVAYKSGSDAKIYWRSLIDTAVNRYIVERSSDSLHFASVLDTAAMHQIIAEYAHTEYAEFPTSTVVYYRLKWTMAGKTDTLISPIRKLQSTDGEHNSISFSAQMSGKGTILTEWKSGIDGIVDHYILERAIEDRSFSTINISKAARHFGQQYDITDAPAGIRQGMLVHYQLTAVLDDGTNIIMPVQTVEWAEANTVAEIYPNPCFDGILNIRWYADPGTDMQVTITDVSGKRMYSATVQSSHWQNIFTLETHYKPNGVYLLQTNIAGNKYVQKVVFE